MVGAEVAVEAVLQTFLRLQHHEARFWFPHPAGRVLSFLYDHGRVLRRDFIDGQVTVEAEVAQSVLRRLKKYACSPGD